MFYLNLYPSVTRPWHQTKLGSQLAAFKYAPRVRCALVDGGDERALDDIMHGRSAIPIPRQPGPMNSTSPCATSCSRPSSPSPSTNPSRSDGEPNRRHQVRRAAAHRNGLARHPEGSLRELHDARRRLPAPRVRRQRGPQLARDGARDIPVRSSFARCRACVVRERR